jgi:hypothetical protein
MADTSVKTVEELLDSQLRGTPQDTCDNADAAQDWGRWDNWYNNGPWGN